MVIALIVTLGAVGSCVLSVMFYSLRDFSMVRLEEIASRNGGMERLRAIVDDDAGHARAVGFARLMTSLVSVLGLVLLFDPLVVVDDGSRVIQWGSLGIVFAMSVAVLFVFSLLLPVAVARYAGERVIHSSVPVIRAIFYMTLPISSLSVIDTAVKRLVGEGATTERDEMEDELLSAVSEGERGGHLGTAERSMIEAVVELGEQTAEEIMTPRTEVEGIEYTDDLESIKAFIAQAGHSRIPVYEGDLDHIVGMLYAKDLIPYAGRSASDFRLRPILRDAVFVPEVKPVNELLVEMQQKKVHIAIVLDEYGGTAGLVTFEDILEEIVGEIQDEYEPEHEREPEVTVCPESGVAEVEARVSVSDANEELNKIGITLVESEDYDTVGGWVMAALGHIPVTDEVFTRDGAEVTVLAAEPTRIHKLRMVVAPPPSQEVASEDAAI